MASERSDLATQIGEVCRLGGEFQLRSGTTATTYFDKYLFESDPAILRAVAEELSQLVPDDIEVLAGLELGGVPIVTALSLATGLPSAFVRKVAKPYGTAKLAEGASIPGSKVLVVEDVITTGGHVCHIPGARVIEVASGARRTRPRSWSAMSWPASHARPNPSAGHWPSRVSTLARAGG